MKRSRFSDEQVIAILKENEAGSKVDDLCRRHGISSATFYSWRKKFGGMEVSDAKKLRELETENARLKRIVADQMLEVTATTTPPSVRRSRQPSAASERLTEVT